MFYTASNRQCVIDYDNHYHMMYDNDNHRKCQLTFKEMTRS